MFRVFLSLLLTLVLWGCTPMVRFNNGETPRRVRQADADTVVAAEAERSGEEENRDLPATQPQGPRTRIDVAAMNRVIARYMATPYQRGGTGALGLDCSGFVYVVYRDYDGTRLPLTVQALFRLEERVDRKELTYGDLVFFRTEDDRKVSHVGIYIDNNKFVHASESRGVTLDDLDSDSFASSFAGARRIK